MHQKFKQLKENPENEGKNVIVKNGKIFVDNDIADKTFFSPKCR